MMHSLVGITLTVLIIAWIVVAAAVILTKHHRGE